jgi:hypothetical protein
LGTSSSGTYTSSATSSRADTGDGGDDTEEEEDDDDGGVKVSMTDMLYIRPLATYIK